ncbi:hypothetical protein [Dokdonella soli]|uniref:Secreted protein n=1 Tax=Dokdonella soli TaxID=529810 RepID=A0ABP3U4J8_9GAMM
MRKILPIIALVCVATLALSACNQGEQAQPQQAAEQKPVVAPMPTNPTDKNAWKQYLVGVVTANMQGVKSNHPYMYFVPGGDDDATKGERNNQLENVKNVVDRGVLPGNMMAFGGPDSKVTAQLIIDAFKDVQAGAFKDVAVLFIGATADADGVKQALATSGADVRFVEAK